MRPDVMTLLKERRTMRKFVGRPVDEKDIRTVLEAGTWAPSAHNAQPWRFAIVRGDGKKRQMADAMGAKWREDLVGDGVSPKEIEGMLRDSKDRIMHAPAIVILSVTMSDMDKYSDERRQELERVMAIQSAAACAQNILLMAEAIGLGGGWDCSPLFAPAEVKKTLGLKPDWSPLVMIALGIPGEKPRPPPRKPVEEVSVWI